MDVRLTLEQDGSGYTKTASTVILTTSSTSCLSSDSTALSVSISSADPRIWVRASS
jgi:hypothetical protein